MERDRRERNGHRESDWQAREKERKRGKERKRERKRWGRKGKIGERQKESGKGVRRTRARETATTMTTTVRPGTINFHALHPPVNSSRSRNL